MSDPSPQVLLDELAQGLKELDEEAYYLFSNKYYPRLRAYFLKNRIPEWVADDLANNCIQDVALKIQQYEPRKDASFGAWIYRIAYNVMVDYFRRNQPTISIEVLFDNPESRPGEYETSAHSSSPKEESSPDLESNPEPLWDQFDETTMPEIGREVQKAIARLDNIDRRIIRLRYFDGQYSFSEIGELFEMKEGTVRQRHSRALKKLEIILREDPHNARWIFRR
ncbi:MAG: RNA polymerase sigma factor [Acidobacteria bacterium]|nr:RNA polymerase sigma factor [Acidobacteriota bacterium]